MIGSVIVPVIAMQYRHASAGMSIYAWMAVATAVLGLLAALVLLGMMILEEFRK